ncbi:MAG TPA: hypothetical protein VFQ04_04860 [Actinomycetes bacterium]|nr:hypothetical protein [Actinomycetes bacterium]
MANHFSHMGLPYPVRGARYTLQLGYLDADGDPTDPTSPDTEVSKDGGNFADCAEEVTVIGGGNGLAYLTLTGAETDCVMLGLAAKGTGPKTTIATLAPQVLPVIESGTAQAGGATSITLAAGAVAWDIKGSIVKTTGGAGGGGTGGANNQARVITSYDSTTKVATVAPDWEVNPAAGTTYDLLLTEKQPISNIGAVLARLPAALVGGRMDASVGAMAADTLTASALAADAVVEVDTQLSATHGAGAWGGGTGGGGPTAGEIAAAVLAAAVTTPVAPPTAPYTVDDILGWILAITKFRRTQSTSEEVLYGDNGTVPVATSAKSDSGTLFERGEYQ